MPLLAEFLHKKERKKERMARPQNIGAGQPIPRCAADLRLCFLAHAKKQVFPMSLPVYQ